MAASLAGAASVSHAATTTSGPANYDYDQPRTHTQDAFSNPMRLAGSSGTRSARFSADLASVRFVERPRVAAKAGTAVARYDADFALGQLTCGGSAKASELVDFGKAQGWTRVQTATGPIKYVDANDVTRLTIKRGSPRAPGSNFPHVEMRNVAGQRIDPFGNVVTRRSPGNHTPIQWDLP